MEDKFEQTQGSNFRSYTDSAFAAFSHNLRYFSVLNFLVLMKNGIFLLRLCTKEAHFNISLVLD
jgi:hypothetical protein